MWFKDDHNARSSRYPLICSIISWVCKYNFSIIFLIFYDFSFIYFSLGFIVVLLQDGLSTILFIFPLSQFLTQLWHIYDTYGLVQYFLLVFSSFFIMCLMFFYNTLTVHCFLPIVPWVYHIPFLFVILLSLLHLLLYYILIFPFLIESSDILSEILIIFSMYTSSFRYNFWCFDSDPYSVLTLQCLSLVDTNM